MTTQGSRRALPLALAALLALTAATADAQVVGTFRWQTQPYCNVLSLTVVQQGPVYQLTGSDDLCGAGTGTLAGTAVVAAGGIAMGFAVALPNGRVVHASTTVNAVNLAGTWTDGDGNTGPFAFVNTSTGGPPRPAPTTSAIVTALQLSPTIYNGTGSAITISRSDHDHDGRYFTQAQINARSPVASFAHRNGWYAITTSAAEVARLNESGAGGLVTATGPIRLVLNGAVTVGNQAGTGQFSMVDCWFEAAASGGAFAIVGLPQSTESIGNSNHDERYAIPLSATIDLPAGSYNARVVCRITFGSSTSAPVMRNAAFSAIAISR